MKSKIAQRILEETPQEAKGKRVITNRELELIVMGFKFNENKLQYELSKYGFSYTVHLYKILESSAQEWDSLVKHIYYDLQKRHDQFPEEFKKYTECKFAQKEIKQKILDLKNKYKSHLQEETNCKIGKNTNFVRETELKAKISALIELENKLGL